MRNSAMTTACWRLRWLGPPQLLAEGPLPIVLHLARKDAALLAYVGLNAGVASAQAAALLWPHAVEHGAMNNLRQPLHRLRKASGARLLDVGDTAAFADDLYLEAMPDVAALEACPDAWAGDLLQGVELDDVSEYSAWLATQRKAWSEKRRDALAAIAAACQRSGELVRAIAYAHRLVADEPLSEHGHRRLMRLHYLRGDRAAAIAAFEACERVLKDELGLRPSPETIELLQTIERSSARPARESTGPTPIALLRPPRSVGRSAERAQLDRSHADGHVASIVGEAGMGKTRLLQDFIAAQPHAVYAQARPGDAAVPYGALARLVRAVIAAAPDAVNAAPRSELSRVAPELADGTVAATPGQTPRLQAAIEHLLASALARGANVLIVDDLHFADSASVEMLRSLVDADALAEVRWAFAHRPIGRADANGALLQALADAPRACWINLAPLSETDLAELISGLDLPVLDPAELASALARHTGGNPLYVLETLREVHGLPASSPAGAGLVLPRPQSIAHMIDRRLQRLSERALALGRVAALAGADFSPELAEHALVTPALLLAGAWAELEAADVLRDNAFAHDLVRDGMLRAIPQAIAKHAHRSIAQHLERRDAEPARVAAHWIAAAEYGAAARAFNEAAHRARLAGRPHEQAQLLLSASAAFTSVGDADEATRARAGAARVLVLSDSSGQAVALSRELTELPEGHQHEALVWSVYAAACMWAGKVVDCEAAARRALALARAEDDTTRMDAVRLAAQACGMQGRADEGLELLSEWESRIDHLDDMDQRIEFCAAYEHLLIQADRPVDSLSWTRKHLAFAERAGDAVEQMSAQMNLAGYFMRQGDMVQGLDHSRRAIDVAPSTEQARALISWNSSGMGYMLCGVGRFSEGLAILEAEHGHTAGAAGPLRANQENWLAQALVTLGQPTRALQLLGADESMPDGLPRGRRLLARAMVQRALGRDDGALLEEAFSATQGPQSRYERLAVELEQASRLDPTGVVVQCQCIGNQARQREYFPLAMRADIARVNALMKLERFDYAADLSQGLEALVGRYQHPMTYVPEVFSLCALANRRAGRKAEASRCLAEALHWLHAVALPNVPLRYRNGFIEGNVTNRRLRQDAAQQWAD